VNAPRSHRNPALLPTFMVAIAREQRAREKKTKDRLDTCRSAEGSWSGDEKQPVTR
jgi:hypothetical protein